MNNLANLKTRRKIVKISLEKLYNINSYVTSALKIVLFKRKTIMLKRNMHKFSSQYKFLFCFQYVLLQTFSLIF